MSKRAARSGQIAAIAFAASACCVAETASSQAITQPQPSGWFYQDTMLGDFGGGRKKLADDGVKFLGVYTGQFGDNLDGGKREGHVYAQQASIAMEADLQRLFNWSGATFRINVNDRVGRGFSAKYTGSKLEQNWAYGAGAIKRLQWAALSQDLYDRKLNLLVGYYSMGSEFGYSAIQAPFLDNGINGHPQILPTDGSGGWNDYPIAGWGARARVYVTPSVTFKAGVFEVNPNLNSGQYGFKLSLRNATGVIVPMEVSKTISLGPHAGSDKAMVGHYTLGGYYETGHAPDILHPEIERKGRHALYFMGDQVVYRSEANSQRWVAVFAQAAAADRRTLPLSSYFDAGVILHAPFDSRPNDQVNIGWVREDVNPRVIRVQAAKEHTLANGYEYAEQDYEANYMFQLTPWLQFTPTLQYVVDPGAYSFKKYRNAFVFSAQIGILF